MPDRCAAYARSSDDKQEASCPQQKQWAQGKAKALGMELAAYHEDEGVPGDVLDRPGLEALFDDLRQAQEARRPVPVLLLFDQDRLSRATSWATGALMERLTRLGVERIVTATEEVDLYDDGQRAIYGLKQDLTKRAYAKAVSKNVSRALAMLAARGCWTGGPVPYGYRVRGGKGDRRLVPGPEEEVHAVKELFRLAAQGVLSTAALARLANERGWPRPAGGKAWQAQAVGLILRSPVYLGVIRYGKQRVGKYHQAVEGEPRERRGPAQPKAPPLVREDCHPALVDRETWERAGAALESRRVERRLGRLRPDDFAFSGKLVCAGCGAVMHGRHRTGESFHGYICSTWADSRGCGRNSVRECDLIDRVAALLADELGTEATLVRLRKRLEAGRTNRGETLRLAVEKGRKHVKNLERQIEAGGRRLLKVKASVVPVVEREIDRLVAELETSRAELADLEKQAAAAHAEGRDIDEVLSRLSKLPELLRNADPAKRATVVRLAVSSIRLRFETHRSPKGYGMTKWTGATVVLRGGGKPYELPVPHKEACRCR
jgi:DNA invertase Pin-like site-specific DNA recombinase